MPPVLAKAHAELDRAVDRYFRKAPRPPALARHLRPFIHRKIRVAI